MPLPATGALSKRILHAGLTVKDAAAADRFYKDALGFSETWRGGRPDGTINWINMRVPDGTDYLEYMLYPDAPPTRRQLGSAHHVALLVPDIQQALETVRARTRPRRSEPPRQPADRRQQPLAAEPLRSGRHAHRVDGAVDRARDGQAH